MKFVSTALFMALAINSAQAFAPSVSSNKVAFNNANTFASSTVVMSQQDLTVLAAEAIEITMPALSSTMKEGRVVSWLKQEGDEVEAGEAIMVVESDKADMDVEAFEDGFIAKILVEEGESAPVGEVVALLVAEEADIAEAAAAGGGAPAAAAVAEPASGELSSSTTSTSNTNVSSTEIISNIVEGSTEIFMPALSSTMVEGKIVQWLKSEGDEILAGEAIMVVESDKADMDVEAFEDGFLAKIIKEEGETVDVGAAVGIIVPEEDDIAKISSAAVVDVETSSDAGINSSTTTTTQTANSTDAAAAASAEAPDCEFSQVDMPALSSTMKEGKVVSWLKAEGDPISAGEAIMVVESDKADMDVEAFEDGFLAAIITDEGESSAVGTPVALIAAEEGDIAALQTYAATLTGAPAPVAAAPAAATPAAAAPRAASAAPAAVATGDRIVASPLAKSLAAEKGVDLSTVAGTGPNGRITAGDVEAAATGAPGKKAAPAAAPAKPAWTPAAGVVAATPMARAAAKKARLDIATIQGTGEFGRVTVDDVQIATGEKKVERKKAAAAGAEAVELPEGLVPFTGMQRAVSNNMEATLSTPVFRVSREVEMDAFNALYQSVKPKGVTVSVLLAKAAALAIEKYPIINSSYTPEGTVFNPDINIAMAVAIDGGLITPTLKYANERNIMELGENWKELVGKAKSGTLSPDEYNSGTFTISNLGMFGVSQFDAILPAGAGGILAIGGTQEQIVPCDKAVLGMKKVSKMTVTLTCDHRQIYGADAALFLKAFSEIMGSPQQLLL
uniref:Dihydrolipoamide acetyltransferase component of pyruvate dehydrogenase complex n=1 Tax=Chaetoceros debilis TaxID=122233 RepID=A0A7S3VCQ0_9STRA|mmetsp:Transcript_26778/g.39629  ORF Transcript_26778/g.39629 Transcript_26778/m.39629 type:complete len:790 (+) Transcript_26778:142-2511(+)